MANTDKENLALARIAYYDLGDTYEFYRIAGQKALLRDVLSDGQKADLLNMGFNVEEGGNAQDWYIVATHDTNEENGFYACIIETSPDHATVAFRGSEIFDSRFTDSTAKDKLTDLGQADIGLLNRIETEQHEECDHFLRKRTTRSTLMQYGHITMTGHSLGGNLAEHTGVMCANDTDLMPRIDSVISLDGPGFSKKYIDDHRKQIGVMADKIHHYRWSPVGSFLFGLPLVHYHHVQSGGHSLSKAVKAVVGDDGHFVRDDEYDFLEKGARDVSQTYDIYLNVFDNPLVVIAAVVTGQSHLVVPWLLSKTLTYAGNAASSIMGDINEVIDEVFVNRDLNKARDEASEFKDFYIDYARFEELVLDCTVLIAELDAMSGVLQILDNGPSESVSLPENIRNNGLIVAAANEVYKVINSFKELKDKVGRSKAYVDRTVETLRGVRTYLSETAADFRLAEQLATQLMQEWEDSVLRDRSKFV